MITLDATTKSLEVVLAGAITTNQLPIVSSYADKTATTFTPASTTTATNGTSTVTFVAAPAASTQREVHSINVYNADTVAATITIRENDNGTLRILAKVTLAVGDTLIYTHAEGWKVTDSSGQIKNTSSPTGTAGGDLSGTYPNPTVAKINGVALGTTTATSGHLLIADGSAWQSVAASGAWTINSSGVATLATVGVAFGGTGLTSGTSGGILGFTASGTLASSAALTANGIVIGGGAGATPTSTAAMTDGQLLVGQTSAAPLPKTISGDVTVAASGAVTIANDAVTNAKLANMATQTIKGRTTAGTGDPEDLTPAQVSTMLANPQITVLTSGSGTYTTPSGAKYLIVECVGGGGGASGGDTTYNNGRQGSAGGATTFGSSFLSAGGGPGGTCSAVIPASSTASGGDLNISGGDGTASCQSSTGFSTGNHGGNSYFGGAGGGGGDGQAGSVGKANTGGGGGSGGATATVNFVPGGGGGAGAYCRKLVTSPSSTYAYAVGAGGAAGTNGSGGTPAAGGSGVIIVTAYFQ